MALVTTEAMGATVALEDLAAGVLPDLKATLVEEVVTEVMVARVVLAVAVDAVRPVEPAEMAGQLREAVCTFRADRSPCLTTRSTPIRRWGAKADAAVWVAPGYYGGHGGTGGRGGVGGQGGQGRVGYPPPSGTGYTPAGRGGNGGNGGSGGIGGNGGHGGTGGTGGVGGAAKGGGLYVSGGSVTLSDDTLSRNSALGGAGASGGLGGAGGIGGGGGAAGQGGGGGSGGETVNSHLAVGTGPPGSPGKPGQSGKHGNSGAAGRSGPGGGGGDAAGGGLYIAAGQVTISQADFTSNRAGGGSGGPGVGGGAGGTGGATGAMGTASGGGIANLATLIVTGSTFTNNQGDVGGVLNDSGTLTVTNSTFSGNSGVGILVSSTTASASIDGDSITGDTTGVLVNNGGQATISESTISNSSTAGVQVENSSGATILNTAITNDSIGILVGSGSGDTSTLTANLDSFSGDTSYGVQNLQTGGSLTATNDWWGSQTGPTISSNPGGTGSKILGGNVSYTPWIGLETDTTPGGQPGFNPTSITLYAVPTKLVFSTEPASLADEGQPFAPQPVVEAEDASGNLGINFNGQVSLTLNVISGTGTLAGTNPVTTSDGVATFSGLSVTQPGTYTLTASASGLSNSTPSSSITISSTPSATFVKTDTTTQGNWIGTYGADGYDLVGGPSSVPSYVTSLTASRNSTYVWSADTTDVRGLENPSSPSPSTNRIAAAWYSSTSFTVTIGLTGGPHDIALYAVDWDKGGRREKITISDAATGSVMDTETLSSFSGGVYEVWTISGHVKITITNLAGPNAVLSGLFFGTPISPPTATFLSSDTTTQGSWMGTYGSDGYNVIGTTTKNPSYPSYATVTASGASTYTWSANTTDVAPRSRTPAAPVGSPPPGIRPPTSRLTST